MATLLKVRTYSETILSDLSKGSFTPDALRCVAVRRGAASYGNAKVWTNLRSETTDLRCLRGPIVLPSYTLLCGFKHH